MQDNELTGAVIGAAIEVHKALGPGLLESVYKECLYYKLYKSGIVVAKEKPLPIVFEEVQLDCGYRMDLLVQNEIVVEVKSVESLSDLHFAQMLTHLRLGNFKLGLLMNFNVIRLKDGIKRAINASYVQRYG